MNPGLGGSHGFRIDTLIAPLEAAARREGLWQPRAYRKGDILLHQGDAADVVFVLESGLVKLVYQTEGGDERIKSFIADQGIFGSADEGDMQRPSRFSAVCLEPCRIARLPLAWTQRAVNRDPEMTNAYVAFSSWVRRRKEAREEMLLCQSPEARYRQLLADEPQLVARLTQGDIARYLGITPIAFSRIKRRMLF